MDVPQPIGGARAREMALRKVRYTAIVVAAFALSMSATARPSSAAVVNDALAQSVNSYRSSHGLPSLVTSPTLQAAAQWMAENVATYGPPATPHVSTDGRTSLQRMTQAGYPTNIAWSGEIIAWGSTSASGAVTLWMNSPTHLALLNDARWRAAGFGAACWGSNPCAWVVDFGSLIDSTVTPPAPEPVAAPARPAPPARSLQAAPLAISAPPAIPAPPASVAPSYHAAFYGESAYPVVPAGESARWVIAFTNTGNTGWSIDGTGARLGTWNPQDAPSSYASSTWIATNRPAEQTTTYVAPGQQAWFVVNLTAPSLRGSYRLYVRPLIDGVTWLEDVGAYVDLVVR